MATASVLEFEVLIAPIAGNDPAGKSVPFAIREKLEEARKEINPDLFPADDPMRPAEIKRADWPFILRQTQETLTNSSKDLLTTARLLEALVKVHGFAGLRDGLHLFRLLIDDCWDRIYPPIEEEGDIEIRAAAFVWLDDPDRGARFPTSVQTVPLVSDRGTSFDWLKWRQAQTGKGSLAGFDEAIAATPRVAVQDLVDDLDACMSELDGLIESLGTRMGEYTPGLNSMRQAVGGCQVLAQQIFAKKGPGDLPPEEAESPAPEEGEIASAAATGPRASRAPTRSDLYHQIGMAAAALKQMEPHSPIPYLLERAVELGALPFPDLMKALVRNADVLQSMNRELGIKERPADEDDQSRYD